MILVKLHVKNTPNGVTVKKIQASQVMNTICQQQVAHFGAMNQHATGCKHASKGHGLTIDMTRKAWHKSFIYISTRNK